MGGSGVPAVLQLAAEGQKSCKGRACLTFPGLRAHVCMNWGRRVNRASTAGESLGRRNHSGRQPISCAGPASHFHPNCGERQFSAFGGSPSPAQRNPGSSAVRPFTPRAQLPSPLLPCSCNLQASGTTRIPRCKSGPLCANC